jgi:lysophospholipid acyltransferase (LPLAT)-like uncharacterized protein
MGLLLSLVGALTIKLLCLTWRLRVTGTAPVFGERPLIFCFWHGRQAALFAHPRSRPMAVLSSLSRDGELQARILARLGFTVFRGSSSRGGSVGLKGLVDALKGGADAVFAVDGPRGPIYRVKPGAALAAEQSGGHLVPVATRASRFWTFEKAWDRYRLPKPFARVEISFGDPIPVEAGGVETARAALESSLKRLEDI